MTSHATYWAQGPLRADDGRSVYVVVRMLPDSRAMAVMECLTMAAAQREAAALNAERREEATA